MTQAYLLVFSPSGVGLEGILAGAADITEFTVEVSTRSVGIRGGHLLLLELLLMGLPLQMSLVRLRTLTNHQQIDDSN